MKILNRYIFGQFAKAFFFASLAFICLFILIDMVEKLDKFMDRHLGIEAIARYYLLSIPSTILLTSPVSALLSSILVAGRLSISSELPAIRSAGVSMRQLLHPFLAGGALICTMNLLNAWWVAPAAFASKSAFEQHSFKKSASHPTEIRNIHILESGNRIVSIESIDTDGSNLEGVSIEEFSGDHLISRNDGSSMHYALSSGTWVMQNVTTRLFTGEGEQYSFMPAKAFRLNISPQSIRELNLQPDEMSIVTHYRYLVKQQQAGFSGLERAMVKFHNKIAMPLASLIIIFIGVPLSSKKKRGGLAAEIAITLFFGFLFLGLQKTISLAGYQGVMDPMLAAWLPNMLFLAIGYVIYKTAID